jgi:hypothetical protein
MSLLSIGRSLTSNKGMAALGVGFAGLGFGNSVGPTARDATLDVVMGDPDADVAFTGRKISTRYLAGSAMGGVPGLALRSSAPNDYATFASPTPTGNQAIATGAVGGVVGAGAGIAAGMKLGRGFFGKAVMAGIGGTTGVAVGGSVGLMETRKMIRDNQQFYSQSPYARNSSSSIANSTNAVGDIVLGMHNSRRGY